MPDAATGGTGPVSIEIEAGVAIVSLNRADKNNAINREMFAGLGSAGARLAADTSVRAVVLQGAGRNFCAGIDLEMFQSAERPLSASDMQPGDGSPANLFQRAAYVWQELPVPVICAIHGVAFGAGLQIAAGADIRIAAPDARLSIMEIKWGIIPDMAITTTLRHVLPADRLKELCWSGRIVSGEQAQRLGLVTDVSDDPQSAARELAHAIAQRSPDAIRAGKRLFLEALSLPHADALRLEARLQLGLLGQPNQAEAVAANLEDRKPEFADPEA